MSVVTIDAVRRTNSFEVTGDFGRTFSALDELVLEHLMVQRALAGLPRDEELMVRMRAEGFKRREIAEELGSTVPKVDQMLQRVRKRLAA